MKILRDAYYYKNKIYGVSNFSNHSFGRNKQIDRSMPKTQVRWEACTAVGTQIKIEIETWKFGDIIFY